ncbi:MAG: hypothetical protein K2Z81_28430 [Cyanobacteria bacterium]|nr:hypothetical protein [Cyanobacteriota bacterium]
MKTYPASLRQSPLVTLLLIVALAVSSMYPCLEAQAEESQSGAVGKISEFASAYSHLSKKILLISIELERFSLNYRLETARQPKFRKLRYYLAQQAGSAGGLAFEITGDKQFGIGRKRPLEIDTRALKNATTAAMTTSIIAGAGSCFELSANVVHSIKDRTQHYDTRSANRFVAEKMGELDQLLAQRDALVQAHSTDPAYNRAVLEGKILHAMRQSFVNEYSTFQINGRSAAIVQNTFYLLNACYNALGAVGAGLANRAVDTPKLNGPANVVFIVSGSLAAVTPFLATASGFVMRKVAAHTIRKELHEQAKFNPDEFARLCTEWKTAGDSMQGGSLIPSLPATERLSQYSNSSDLFVKQLENETRTMRRLNKVALQTSTMAPPIGSLLMTQGILGARGYYKYGTRPRKQLDLFYRGAICGTVATSMALVGNTGWLLASWHYENGLKRKNQLPEQLIKKRLEHLDDVEKMVQSIN